MAIDQVDRTLVTQAHTTPAGQQTVRRIVIATPGAIAVVVVAGFVTRPRGLLHR